ncbi:MAG TPA: NADH-quinone oxidoreductase subunit L [Candidatus Dormibacteraeota bacterium]|jgi:NADH-quinone oxidoreductase subunit L|nr:NADH-quinone oxidoreductase subunit L [Candidatus Dormibacteraeota bacterium]
MNLQVLPLLILGLPALGALVLALTAQRTPRIVPKLVGPGMVWLAFICTLVLLVNSLQNDSPHVYTYWTWISSGRFTVPFNLLIDRLSIFMAMVVTGVGGLIVTYSVGYMEHEDKPSYARFFCYLDLFITSMLLLVLAGNFIFLIVGWAAVGLSSYLLIGYWYWRNAAVVAARKAFVMNVIGDVGMILAAFVLFVNVHTLTFSGVFAELPHHDTGWVEAAGFLLLVGAVAKSAQLPLHTWLPDAMEGPTPVSALIHAATMVTAGVYLVGRMHPIFNLATGAHDAVAVIGGVTAIFAATIAIVQTDIKRVLAYSTMSQIGYMFLAVGVGAYSAGFFHLMSHAFFKALLFMAAGNIIHSMHDEQDMRKYGGLWKQMRWTSIAFLVGSLALSGIFPFDGFFSKEMLLGETFSKPGTFPVVLWAVGFVTAVLTAFYTGRMWWIAFAGKPSPDRPVEHPHEARPIMLIPVLILALLTVVGGWIQLNALTDAGPKVLSTFLSPVVGSIAWTSKPAELAVTLITLVLAILAFLAAYQFYVSKRWPTWSRALPRIQVLLEHKYFFDEIYDLMVVRVMDLLSIGGDRYIEEPLIDGTVNAVGTIAESSGEGISVTENGLFRTYALVFLVGALVAAVVVLLYRSLS